MKLKVLSLFSGIGAFEKALKNLKIDVDLVNFCEIDKFAIRSYCAIHDVDESLNLGDITKVNEKTLSKDIDLVTYGFPYQDISLAGHRKGLFNNDGTQTRSGLFFDALRIIEEVQPKVAIAENVKNLVGKKFAPQFNIVLQSLENAGYNNYWTVLNARDYGVPHNRERVFIVSIRKDVDTGEFKFPEAVPLGFEFIDLLEDHVDEKFNMSEKCIEKMKRYMPKQCDLTVCPTLRTELAHGSGKNVHPKIYKILTHFNITPRILTPKECFRFIGFDDEDCEKAQVVNSNTQLFKQIGNSIVVNVLEGIFCKLLNGAVKGLVR